jgi:hypothetical protein
MKKTFVFSVLLAVVIGIAIAWIDSRPNWDDTGVSVFMVLVASLLCGFLAAQRPWLIALAVGVWIPLFGIVSTQNFGSLLALLPGFSGAYAAYGFRKMINGS